MQQNEQATPTPQNDPSNGYLSKLFAYDTAGYESLARTIGKEELRARCAFLMGALEATPDMAEYLQKRLLLRGIPPVRRLIRNTRWPEMQAIVCDALTLDEESEFTLHSYEQKIRLWEELSDHRLARALRDAHADTNPDESATDLMHLFFGRTSWTRALIDLGSIEEVRTLLLDPETRHALFEGYMAAALTPTIHPYPAWRHRERLPISEGDTYDPVTESRSRNELRGIIRASGIEEIMKRCASSVRIMGADQMSGNLGYYFKTDGAIWVTLEVESGVREQIPGTLFHETGHAVMHALAAKKDGQMLFDRYAVQAMFGGPYRSSGYVAPMQAIDGTTSDVFIMEAFAEDFRIFLEHPPLLPEGRYIEMRNMFRAFFPDIDLEEIRRKIASMYGTYYGKSARDVQDPVLCGNTFRRTLKYRHGDRRQSRDEQEAADAEENASTKGRDVSDWMDDTAPFLF